MSKAKTETYASVWDALADTPEQAANLRARAGLMQQIAAIVNDQEWTQMDAAKLRCDAAAHQRSVARPGVALFT